MCFIRCAFLSLAFAAFVYSGTPGVVVESVEPLYAGQRAGIQPGDVITGWNREGSAAEGKVDSPFDMIRVEIEQAPRGEIRMSGLRGDSPINVLLPAGEWKIETQPRLPDPIALLYSQSKAKQDAVSPDQALQLLRNAVEAAGKEKETKNAVWLYVKQAELLLKAGKKDEATTSFQSAVLLSEHDSDKLLKPLLLCAEAKIRLSGNDLENAQIDAKQAAELLEPLSEAELLKADCYFTQAKAAADLGNVNDAEALFRKSLDLRKAAVPESYVTALTLTELAKVLQTRGDMESAAQLHSESHSILEKKAADSPEYLKALNDYAVHFAMRGELSRAEEMFLKCLAVHERTDPNSLPHALALLNLGNVAFFRGDLFKAESFYRRSMAIREKLSPQSMEFAQVLNNLGSVLANRGDLSAAEDAFRKALAVWEKVAPESDMVGTLINNIGNIAYDRGDNETAEQYLRKSLAIGRKQAPGSMDVAMRMMNLGNVLKDKGDYESAEEFIRGALSIQESQLHDSIAVARTIYSLASLDLEKGDPLGARDLAQKAIALHDKLVPGGLESASVLQLAGDIELQAKNPGPARSFYEKALASRSKLAAGSRAEAESLHGIGMCYRAEGALTQATDCFRRAVAALEAQKGKLGGSENVRIGFGAQYLQFYQDYIEVLIETRQESEAFHILERSRARSLLSMLAERDLTFSAEIPEDLEQERKRIDVEYDRIQGKIAEMNPATEEDQIKQLMSRMTELNDQRDAVVKKIRQASPRLASLQYPEPLDLAGTQQILDPGTVLLSYSVGKEKSYLFAVNKDKDHAALHVYPLAWNERAIKEKVEAYRNLIQRKESLKSRQALFSAGKELFDGLIAPAEKIVEKAKHVLIVPDGPLYILPFSAMIREWDPKRGKVQFLMEWKPTSVEVSATVYAEIRKEKNRPSHSAGEVIVFGDPLYTASSELQTVSTRGLDLTPLPATRDEARSIEALYPGSVKSFLGKDATEEEAKHIGKDARFIHFACHGFIDERFPLNSALALAIPRQPAEGQENGLLQAWEVFEQIRIHADLVTLSACETGLGKEMRGEGLIGLTRAFQFAGARSVLASLWNVSDESTAEFMKDFYRHLKNGFAKNEALQMAQKDMLAASVYSHPYYWAAFQLNGDWE